MRQRGANHHANANERGKIHVLSLQTGSVIGGSELMAFSLLSRIDRNKFDVTVCFSWTEGPVSEMYRQEGIEVFHLGHRPTYRVIWRLWKLLSRRHFDIIDIYGLRINIIGRILGWLTGHRVIITSQRSVDDWRRFWHVWLDRLTSHWVTLYIANCHAAARRLQEREKLPPSRIKVIQNGIDITPFAQAQAGLVRRELAIEPNRAVITCVANFKEVKGHRILIDAIAALYAQNPDFCLWLVGDGPLRPEIEHQIRELGLENAVMFLGQRSDVPHILVDTDIFALASLWEGMPGVILEAMAARLPVVATSVGGIPEMVVHGQTGYLVPPRDSGALATSLARLLEDEESRLEMGEAGYRRVRSHFSLDAKVRELENVYEELYHASRNGVVEE